MHRRLLSAIAVLLALSIPANAAWETKGQGFISTTSTTTVADLSGITTDGWLTVRQITITATADGAGSAPWVVSLTRDGAVFQTFELYASQVFFIDFGGDGKRMYNFQVTTNEQPSTTGSVTVRVEYGK